MKVLDLFSGIGGFSLGLERAGMETVAFCENDPFCREKLYKHWTPFISIFDDVKSLLYHRGALHGTIEGHNQFFGTNIDVICGGFPCQDISVANYQGEGLDGKRSGLWSEFKRLIGEVKPSYAIIENVPNLRNRGLATVLKDLWEIGYECEWHIIPASALGFFHRRERLWIIAYPYGNGRKTPILQQRGDCFPYWDWQEGGVGHNPEGLCEVSSGNERGGVRELAQGFAGRRKAQSDILRVDDGIPLGPYRNKRIKALGNSLVPQIAEIIGKSIMYHHEIGRYL